MLYQYCTLLYNTDLAWSREFVSVDLPIPDIILNRTYAYSIFLDNLSLVPIYARPVDVHFYISKVVGLSNSPFVLNFWFQLRIPINMYVFLYIRDSILCCASHAICLCLNRRQKLKSLKVFRCSVDFMGPI